MYASKSLFHSWDLVVDYLLNLEMVTRETKHPKAGFYSAVFQAVKEKALAREDCFGNTSRCCSVTRTRKRWSTPCISKVDKVFKEPSSCGQDSLVLGPVPNWRQSLQSPASVINA